MIGEVLSVERVVEEAGKHGTNIKVDTGGGSNLTADFFPESGDDSPPLPGDSVALVDIDGSGSKAAVGCNDPNNAGKAANGERRTYARDADGNIVSEIWSKRDGSITITSIKPGSVIIINGVSIDQDGNITVPGKVSAAGEVTANTESAPVKLSTHIHPTGIGPTSPPTPG